MKKACKIITIPLASSNDPQYVTTVTILSADEFARLYPEAAEPLNSRGSLVFYTSTGFGYNELRCEMVMLAE